MAGSLGSPILLAWPSQKTERFTWLMRARVTAFERSRLTEASPRLRAAAKDSPTAPVLLHPSIHPPHSRSDPTAISTLPTPETIASERSRPRARYRLLPAMEPRVTSMDQQRRLSSTGQ